MVPLLTIAVVAGSVLGGVLCICAFLAVMFRVLRYLEAAFEPPRQDRRDTGPSAHGVTRPILPHRPQGATDPAWWPRFERDFAEYVELLQSRASDLPED